MKRLAPLLAALLSAATASAQTTFSFGLRGGGQLASTTLASTSTTTGSYFSYSTDKSMLPAWQAGVVAEVGFSKFALQPALLFSQKGEEMRTTFSSVGSGWPETSETTSTNRYNWLEVPLNLVYTLHRDHGMQFFAGPYVAWAVGGRKKGSWTTSAFLPPDTPTDFNQKITYGYNTSNQRFDAGINFGVGYRKGPLQAQLGYGVGFRKLHMVSETVDFAHDPGGDAA